MSISIKSRRKNESTKKIKCSINYTSNYINKYNIICGIFHQNKNKMTSYIPEYDLGTDLEVIEELY